MNGNKLAHQTETGEQQSVETARKQAIENHKVLIKYTQEIVKKINTFCCSHLIFK